MSVPPAARSILPQGLYPWVHQVGKRLFPQCVWDVPVSQDRPVLLTFDDGPHPQHTPAVLEVLEQWQIKASFFLLGQRVQQWPQITAQIAAAGHHLGLHGFDHRSFTSLSAVELRSTLLATQRVIQVACCDNSLSSLDVRPPNGLFWPGTIRHLRQWGYRPVMWSLVPEDWLHPPIEVVIERICNQVYPGALIVLHDGVYGGAQVTETVDRLIPLLLQQGYRFISLAEVNQGLPLSQWPDQLGPDGE